jgi:antibiotic biosynthesis monooxygenase (ABM) superfamily enzyme
MKIVVLDQLNMVSTSAIMTLAFPIWMLIRRFISSSLLFWFLVFRGSFATSLELIS